MIFFLSSRRFLCFCFYCFFLPPVRVTKRRTPPAIRKGAATTATPAPAVFSSMFLFFLGDLGVLGARVEADRRATFAGVEGLRGSEEGGVRKGE